MLDNIPEPFGVWKVHKLVPKPSCIINVERTVPHPSAQATLRNPTISHAVKQQGYVSLTTHQALNNHDAMRGDSVPCDRPAPYLTKSHQSGNRSSAVPLAMALLAQDKRSDSVKVLKEYTRANPSDPQAQELLEAIESGQIRVQNM